MPQPAPRRLLASAALAIAAIAAGIALSEPTRVTFPENIDTFVHYTTVTRGNVVEHMLIPPAAIEAVRAGQPLPDGTHVVLADYRDGEIYRYFIMQKGPDWGADYDEDSRTADWQYQWFWADRSINMEEDTARCRSCHQSREGSDYLFTYNDLRRFAQ